MKIIPTVKEKVHLTGFVIGAFKVIMAIISRSWLIFIHAVYNIIKACAMHYAKKERDEHHVTMFYSGLFVVAASIVYLIYSIYIYAFGCKSTYHMNVAIGIAAITVYELVMAAHGLRKAKRKNDFLRETVKYINLASALISISLTQTAILSFTNETDVSKAYAVGDAIFGFLALLVGLFMLLRSKKVEKINNLQ